MITLLITLDSNASYVVTGMIVVNVITVTLCRYM